MKVLILEENEDDAKKGIATSQNGEAQPSAENSSDGPSVDMATSGTTTATTTTIEAAAATSTEPGDDDHQSGESADVRTEADEVAVAEAVDDGNDQDKTEETKEGDKPQKKEMTPKTARRTVLTKSGERGRAGTASILDDMKRMRRREQQQSGSGGGGSEIARVSPRADGLAKDDTDTPSTTAQQQLKKAVMIQTTNEKSEDVGGGKTNEEESEGGGGKEKKEKDGNFIRRKMARASLLLRSNEVSKELARMEKSEKEKEKKNEDGDGRPKEDVEEEGYGRSMNLSEGGLIMLTYSSKMATRRPDGATGDDVGLGSGDAGALGERGNAKNASGEEARVPSSPLARMNASGTYMRECLECAGLLRT
jgi:hypothetical protein